MKIAVLGTGTMGTELAKALLLNTHHDVIVYDRTVSKTEPLVKLGAKATLTSAEAISEADASILVVIDGNAVKDVLLNGETKKVLSGKKILNVSTTNAEEIESINNEVIENGGNLAELSIMNNAHEISEKPGYFLLGCDESVESFWKKVLKNIGEINYVGKVGDASRAETPILFNTLFMNMSVVFSAAIALKYNIPEQVITKQLSSFVPGAEYMLPSLLARDYSQGMATVDGFKDTGLIAINAAKSVNMPTDLIEAIVDLYSEASNLGLGNKAETAILEVLLDKGNK